MTTFLYPSGSEWRKWDLHVHTPNTQLNDNYQLDDGNDIWDTFCQKIEESDVEVFGITDYFSVKNYFTFLEKFKAKYPASKKQFFPNIEFRLEDKNKENDNINIHIIFSNKLNQEEIQKFLDDVKLENISSDRSISKCIDSDLTRIGYANALVKKESIEQSLKDTFGNRNVFLICGVANGYGGIRPPQHEGRHTEYAKTIDEVCKIFFGRSQDKDFFLGERYEGSIPKPVVCGCDAHSFTNMDEWLGKRVTRINAQGVEEVEKDITWIKADPTFEGLKEIIYEPDERIKIQENNPYEDKSKIFFSTLSLTGSTNYILSDFVIPLNRNLVTIIGGRGSGKSALLDTAALFNEEHLKRDQNDKKKIIDYYRDNEGRTDPAPTFTIKTTLIDKDGQGSDFEKLLNNRTNLELPFLYLGQEQLSGIATNDSELTKTIRQLIGIDINEIGQDTLITKARTALSDIDNTQKQIDGIIERYTVLGYSSQAHTIESWITEHLEKLKEQQKRLSSKETRTILEDINKKTERGIKLKELSGKASALMLSLRDIPANQAIGNFNSELLKLYPTEAEVTLLDSAPQIAVFAELQKKIDADMQILRDQITQQKRILITQGIKEDVNSLLQASESLQRQIGGIEKDLQSYKDAQTKLGILHKERATLLVDIETVLTKSKNDITEAFKAFQESRSDSTVEEKELFEKIIQGITVEGQIDFDQRTFLKHVLSNFVDKRSITNESDLKKMIAGENPDGSPKDITFKNLAIWIQTDLTSERRFSRSGLNGITEFIFTQWPSFLMVKAVAKLNGKPTEILSIGQRGTLLLKVYLATSTAKQVFIIDQPEDNLDNNFIMNELVPLIRRAKQSRQIIMSTHNANLVVNADSEQIIIARLEQGKNYLSGSIESPIINQYIRDILEGGEEAFRQREKKYLFVR